MRWNNVKILREFKVGDNVILFNSRYKLFLSKIKMRWSGPFKVLQYFPNRVVELEDDTVS